MCCAACALGKCDWRSGYISTVDGRRVCRASLPRWQARSQSSVWCRKPAFRTGVDSLSHAFAVISIEAHMRDLTRPGILDSGPERLRTVPGSSFESPVFKTPLLPGGGGEDERAWALFVLEVPGAQLLGGCRFGTARSSRMCRRHSVVSPPVEPWSYPASTFCYWSRPSSRDWREEHYVSLPSEWQFDSRASIVSACLSSQLC